MSASRAPRAGPPLEGLVRAQRAWAGAGVEARTEVLIAAGRRLSERREELDRGLRLDGLSQKLADYYGDWIVHQGSEPLLRRHARDLVRWYETAAGPELLVRRADGVVLLVTPANSPTISAAAIFSILLPGNGVVVRSPPNDGGLRFIVEDVIGSALAEHGFASDLVEIVVGKSRPVIDTYLPREEVRTVVFFGNSAAGRSVAERCHALGKKAVLELDGSDHMIVWKDADLDGAVDSALHAFDFSTQPCPIPKHLLVHEDAYDGFLARLDARLAEVSVTAEADPVRGNLVPVARPEGYFEALEEVRPLGVIRTGGYRMDARGQPDADGPYVAPTLVELDAEVVLGRSLRCFDEEIFFPLIPVVRFRGGDEEILADMLRLVDESPFGLRLSAWTSSPVLVEALTRSVGDVGLLLFNDDHAQCPSFASPWGGPKRSGGPHGESHLFWEKTSHLQAIGARRLDPAQVRAVVRGLGYFEDAGPAPAGDDAGPTLELVLCPEEPARLSIEDGIATVTLSRPGKHNAIDEATKDRLLDIAETLHARRRDLTAVVIEGSGPSFCSGGDLSAIAHFSSAEARRFMHEATRAFRGLSPSGVPVLAAVRGYCLGGGLELALHCDFIVADLTARFGFPETSIGLVTTAGSVDRMCRAVGERRAREMLVLGRRLGAEEALAAGLVAEVADDLEGVKARWLERLRHLPPGGVRAMSELFARRARTADDASWMAELDAFETLVRREREGSAKP